MKIKKNVLLITSLIVLLPIVIGLLLWRQLPEQIATHFDFSGKPDGYSSKFEAVFFLPGVMLLTHLFCIWLTSKDPKSGGLGKMQHLIYWIVPVISIFAQSMVFLVASGFTKISVFNANLFLGLLFLVLGNYLPKVRQNYTVGIKLPWTLNDETNWNKTHRLAGKLWVVGGLALFIFGLFGIENGSIILISLAVILVVPMIYSYRLFKNDN
ncbi:SdpI family protein [Streptococcus iniae]|nr:SdpI family protein [Streptococcus iniae]